MRLNLFDKIRFNSASPVVARAAGSALVGSLNFSVSNLIQRHLKNERYGMPTPGGIDAANEEIAEGAAQEEAARVRIEQGFDAVHKPLELAASLKCVRNYVQGHLLENAGKRPDPSNPGKDMVDRFHVGRDFADSLEFQARARMKMGEGEAAALAAKFAAVGATVEHVRIAENRRNNRQSSFVVDNRGEILACYERLICTGEDGHVMGIEQAETVFDRLPAMAQLRMVVAADKGLYNAWLSELERALNGSGEALGNMSFLVKAREELAAVGNSWLKDPKFAKEIKDTLDQGGTMPAWAPATKEQVAKAA